MKKYLNLDPEFTPFGNTLAYEKFIFSGGEPHIRIKEALTGDDEVVLTTRISNFEAMGLLLLATDAVRRFGIKKISVFIPYFPAARQDRVMVPGEPLSVKVYADMLNAMQYDQVLVIDPHSEVTPALVNNIIAEPNYNLVKKALENIGDYLLVSPDGGALKKIYKVSAALGNANVVECSKKRDVTTGKLSGFRVLADDLNGKTCVIVDDICDGGNTFIGLAEELKKKNAGKLILIVTHGIFSKGTEQLTTIFDHVYCSDSFRNINSNEHFTQIQLAMIISKPL